MASISDLTDDDRLLIARVKDTCRLAGQRNCPCSFGFLDLTQQATVADILKPQTDVQFMFSGGYPEAERKFFVAYPDFYSQDDITLPIRQIAFRYRSVSHISHRDVLGTLLSLGIRRECVGDILCGDGFSVVFVAEDIAEYVLAQVRKIGGEGVTAVNNYDGDLPVSRNYEEISATIASARLDVVIKTLLRCSREQAAQCVISGSVSVNHRPVSEVSAIVHPEDTVSVKGVGRFLIDRIGPETKKGRLFFLARKCV